MPQINSNFKPNVDYQKDGITLIFSFRLISKDNFKCANRQGRQFLSKEFKDWEYKVKYEAGRQIPRLTVLPIFNKEEELIIKVMAYFTNKKHSDTTNLFKGIDDALQGIVYPNDNQIKQASIKVYEDSPEDFFTVKVEKLPSTLV